MAFGGSGWAGGLREVRGFALAVDMAPVPRRRASLSDKWANAPPFVFGLGASVDGVGLRRNRRRVSGAQRTTLQAPVPPQRGETTRRQSSGS